MALTHEVATASPAMSNNSLRERCHQVAATLLEKNNWTLASADDPSFIESVWRRVVELFPGRLNESAEVLDDAIHRAVKNMYCDLLYEAYGKDGSDEQWRAMEEVKQFVYPRLLYMTKGDDVLAGECTQYAISQAWLTWDKVRAPGSFLGYVLRIGIHEVLAAQKGAGRLADIPDENINEPQDAELVVPQASVEHIAETNDMLDRVQEVVEKCLSQKDEARLIIGLFLEGRSYKELAKAWRQRPAHLYLLKFRAMEKLMQCKEFLDLRHDWLGRG